MTAWAYYNEHDPFAAAWIRELIKAGHVAPGEVDERSIEDVTPDDLRGFTQCHFFAGIAVWSHSLRRAGLPDDYRIWTGSAPCQPFSAAGKGAGFADERHLWPAFYHLITQCEPERIVGEQVASKDGLAWVELVQADMEAANYAFGAVDLCAAGVGAPHIRQRLWWVGKRLADADQQQRNRSGNAGPRGRGEPSDVRTVGRLGDDDDEGLEGQRGGYQAEGGRVGTVRPIAETGEFGGVADNESAGRREQCSDVGGCGERSASEKLEQRSRSGSLLGHNGSARPTNGFWGSSDWVYCRDGRWRPVEPGTFPLVNGAPARMVATCSCCKTETRWVNGAPSKTNAFEVLQTLRFENGEKASAFGGSGGAQLIQPSAILHRSMLWGIAGENPQDERRGAYSSETDRETAFLQSVWRIRMAAGSSQGPKSVQQYADEFGSPLYPVPSGRTFQADPEVYLCGLRALVLCARPSEPEQDLFCPVCENIRTHQCIKTLASRVGELRGYGNAIVATAAEEFLRAALT